MNTFNTKEDGTHLYRFYYVEPIIDIYAYDLEQAMERYLAYCQKNELNGLYDDEADDDDEMHCYTDPTMEDSDCHPAYIRELTTYLLRKLRRALMLEVIRFREVGER